MHQIAFGAIGVVVMFAGGWLFWYFAVRPHHPSPYSLFEIVIVPLALLVMGILCLLAAVGAFTDARLKLRTGQAAEELH
jgi:drug/metabolite transporter (DMT)-like permease